MKHVLRSRDSHSLGGKNRLGLVVLSLLLASCGGQDAPVATPQPSVDKYALYADLVERGPLLGPPKINRGEAARLAEGVCASTVDGFQQNLTITSSQGGIKDGLDQRLLDRRMFVIAYCPERVEDFDMGAKQACTEAAPIVGRNCPGKFSTLPTP